MGKILAALCLIGVLGVWYFFIDTVTLRELAGKPQGSAATVLVNLIDFDTGLTRYDVYRLKERTPYWVRRTNEVDSIPDLKKRNEEQMRLLAEMMEDPVFGKISKRVFGFGAGAAMSLLRALN